MIGAIREISTAMTKEGVHTLFVYKSRLIYKHGLTSIWAEAIRIRPGAESGGAQLLAPGNGSLAQLQLRRFSRARRICASWPGIWVN
jgi:hypothetical protein